MIYAVEDRGARGVAVRQRLSEAGDEIVAISMHDHYVAAIKQFRSLPLGEEQFIRATQLLEQSRAAVIASSLLLAHHVQQHAIVVGE